MTEIVKRSLSTFQANILITLLGASITIGTVVIGSLYLDQKTFREEVRKSYVTLEQYRVDEKQMGDAMCRLESKIDQFSARIDNKLDKIILRQK